MILCDFSCISVCIRVFFFGGDESAKFHLIGNQRPQRATSLQLSTRKKLKTLGEH